jgi:hypothetical protein
MFYDDYVRRMRPLVLRGAVADDPALRLWNSKYLRETYGGMKVRMETKDEGDFDEAAQVPSEGSLKRFLAEFKDAGYVVTQLPDPMSNETTLPSCISCGPVTDHILEANLWVSTGNTMSLIHKDSNNQLNCLYSGVKDWTLFSPVYGPRLYLVDEQPGVDQTYDTAGFSRIPPRAVDLKEWPLLEGVPFMRVRVRAGDCIYVPGSYLHQVPSTIS